MRSVSPPVSAAEVYAHLTGSVWQNHLAAAPFDYDLRSRYAAVLGGSAWIYLYSYLVYVGKMK